MKVKASMMEEKVSQAWVTSICVVPRREAGRHTWAYAAPAHVGLHGAEAPSSLAEHRYG